jgi:hypothetical protein
MHSGGIQDCSIQVTIYNYTKKEKQRIHHQFMALVVPVAMMGQQLGCVVVKLGPSPALQFLLPPLHRTFVRGVFNKLETSS